MIESPTPIDQSAIPPAPQNKPVHWPSILAAIGGILTILVVAGGAVLFFISGLTSTFSPETASDEAVMLLSYSVTGVLVSVLVLPVVILAVRRLSGRADVRGEGILRFFSLKNPQRLIWLYPILVLAGYFLQSISGFDLLLMPMINVLVLSIPVAWLAWLGMKNLRPSSLQRNWTTFGLGMTISPMLIIFLEIVALVIGLIVFALLVATLFPDVVGQIEDIARLLESAAATMEVPDQEIVDLVQSPAVIGGLLLFASGVVPLIEEAIKPLGVWLLAGRDLTPQDGWVLGLLSGAGFALVENLGNLAVGAGWTFLMLARAGAAGLHMFNSAIIGYTFVLSRRQKRWRPFILAFLGTLVLHALWNTVAVVATVQSLSSTTAIGMGWPLIYVVILGAAAIGTYVAIDRFNHYLAGKEKPVYAESENDND